MINLIKELRQRYAVVPLVLLPREGALFSELKKLKIPCIVASFYCWSQSGGALKRFTTGSAKLILNQLTAREISRKLGNTGISLVHSNSSVIDFGAILAEKMNLPHIWHLREFGDLDYNLSHIPPKALVKKKLEMAASLISVSKSVTTHFTKIAPEGRFLTIHNGIDVSLFSTNTPGMTTRVVQFALVGLIQEKKGQWDMVDAVANLVEMGIQNFHVHVIGDGQIEALKKAIDAKALSNRITLHGKQRDIPKFLHGVHVGLTTSHAEAFGRTTIEYQLAGLPVIATETGAGAELVENGMNGYLIPPRRPKALSLVMRHFCEHPDSIGPMGQRAQQFARENFDSRRATDLIFQAYGDVLCNTFR